MPKHCSFCDQKNTPTSDEHIIPKWMALLYPDITWAIENRLTKYVRKSTKFVHITVPLCQPCNNGWMSDLEKVAAPILTPLIEGVRTILSPRDQIVLQAWFCLRAMVYDLHAEINAPRPRYFKDEEHRQLATTQTYYPYYEFFLGRYKGNQLGLMQEDHFDSSFFRPATQQYEGNVTRSFSMTFVFKHLVLQILCIKSPEPLTHNVPDLRAFCFKFGEPFAINSFPPFRFSDKTINDFVYRWSKQMKMAPVIPPDTPGSIP